MPPVKPRWADFTDAGPGVGCSNFEVRFRDAELALIHIIVTIAFEFTPPERTLLTMKQKELTALSETVLLMAQPFSGSSTRNLMA